MSQTETLLLVVLGFSLAALIFLFVGRFLWSLALRLGSRRMQRQVPSTVAELHGERDRLRAEYAKISQKLGSRLDGVKMQMAEQMAEVTRNRNRVDSLVMDINARDQTIAARDQTIVELRDLIATLEAEAADSLAALAAMRDETARRDLEIAELQTGLRAITSELAASLPPEIPRPLPPPVPLTDKPAAEARLKRRIEKLTSMSQEIAESRTADQLDDPVLQEKLALAARETEDIEKELARLDAAWNSKLATGQPPNTESPPGEPSQPRAVANVISLANRIRTLQKDIAR